MNDYSPAQMYYHGTWSGYGDSIMQRGFELGHPGLGHLLGRGVYIARDLASAALWEMGLVINVRLEPGTRILWIEGDYNQHVIDSLRREFGQELLDLGPHFERAIPHNKQLTQRELIHLCDYVLIKARRGRWRSALRAKKGKRVRYAETWRRLSRLHGQIKRYGYDAIGDRSNLYWDSDEILVFNPARVIPVSAHRLIREGEDFDESFSLSPALEPKELSEIAARAIAEEEEDAEGLV